MKPFKTHRQQIKILRDRGLIVNSPKALRILERENYYNVINGYKDPFLEHDQNGNSVSPETIEGELLLRRFISYILSIGN
jgi:abortive infection bacteriophage resistance protein